MVSKILFLALIVGTASAATWLAKLPEKPKELAYKEGCYVKEINDVIPFGSSVTPLGYCYRIGCRPNLMDYSSCGVIGTDDLNCIATEEDLSKPYPECCPSYKCEIDNNLV